MTYDPTKHEDWTMYRGKTNCSPQFVGLANEIARIIRDSAHDLIAGRTQSVASFILAQLAHRYGLVPVNKLRADQLLSRITETNDLQEAREIALKLGEELGLTGSERSSE